MKTKLFFLKQLLFLLPIVAITACNSSNHPDQNNTTSDTTTNVGANLAIKSVTFSCTGERDLLLETHTLSTASAHQERDMFDTTIYAGASLGSLTTRADNVLYSEFSRLKGYADGISSACPSSSVITGLRLSFGLEEDLSGMKIIYEPIKMCLISSTVVTQGGKSYTNGTFSVVGTYSVKYCFDETANNNIGEFVSITNDVAIAGINLYKNSVRIKHTSGAAATSFTTGDVESVIFSFQEIKALYDDNDSPEHPEYISVWNTSRDFILSGPPVRKHSLILGPDYLGVSDEKSVYFFSGEFRNAFANLAHLCPPNCQTLIFRIK